MFLAMVPSHLIACVIDTRRGNTIFNWLVRSFLVVWAVKRTWELTSDESKVA